jgi:hypothetical protein
MKLTRPLATRARGRCVLVFIEGEEEIEKIFKHLGLCGTKVRPPFKVR